MNEPQSMTVNTGDILHSTPEFVEWIQLQNLRPVKFTRTYVVWRASKLETVSIAVYQKTSDDPASYELFPFDIPVSIAVGMKLTWQTIKQPSVDAMMEIVARHREFVTGHSVDRQKLRNYYGTSFDLFLIFTDWLSAYNDEAFMATQEGVK